MNNVITKNPTHMLHCVHDASIDYFSINTTMIYLTTLYVTHLYYKTTKCIDHYNKLPSMRMNRIGVTFIWFLVGSKTFHIGRNKCCTSEIKDHTANTTTRTVLVYFHRKNENDSTIFSPFVTVKHFSVSRKPVFWWNFSLSIQ